MKNKSVIEEAEDIRRAVEMVQLGARMQMLEVETRLRACELFGHARRRGREWVCDRCGGQMICSA